MCAVCCWCAVPMPLFVGGLQVGASVSASGPPPPATLPCPQTQAAPAPAHPPPPPLPQDEYFSSQKCAKCTAQLLPHTTRTKCCPSSTCKNAIYNRDANAAENLAKIWEACLDGKDRPSQLRRPAVPPQRRGPGRTSTARRQPQPEVPVPVTPGLPLADALSGPVAAGARGAAGAASGQ